MIEFPWQTIPLPEIDYLDRFVQLNQNLNKEEAQHLGINEVY